MEPLQEILTGDLSLYYLENARLTAQAGCPYLTTLWLGGYKVAGGKISEEDDRLLRENSFRNGIEIAIHNAEVHHKIQHTASDYKQRMIAEFESRHWEEVARLLIEEQKRLGFEPSHGILVYS